MLVHDFNHNTLEMEASESLEFQAIQGYIMRLSQKTTPNVQFCSCGDVECCNSRPELSGAIFRSFTGMYEQTFVFHEPKG